MGRPAGCFYFWRITGYENYEMISQAAYSGLTVEEDSLNLWGLDPVLTTFLNEVIKASHAR